MISIQHHPDRIRAKGQFYLELVQTGFGDDGPPRGEVRARLGYWCDRLHLERIAADIERALKVPAAPKATPQVQVTTYDVRGLPHVVVHGADNYRVTDRGLLVVALDSTIVAQYTPGRWVTANTVGQTGSVVA